MYNEKFVLNLIEKIYNSALNPETWPETIHELGKAIGFESSAFVFADPHIENLELLNMQGFDESAIRSMETYYYSLAPQVSQHIKFTKPGDVHVNRDVLRSEDFERTEYYNGYMKHHRLLQTAGFCFSWVGDRLGIFEFQRPKNPVICEETEILRLLTPHFIRAIQITRQFWTLQNQLSDARVHLDRLSMGVILIDEEEGLGHLNRRAEQIVSKEDQLLIRRNQLSSPSVEPSNQLQKFIHEAVLTGRGLADHTGGSLLLAGKSEENPLRVLVVPVHTTQKNLEFHSPRICAAVYISPTHGPDNISAKTICILYGLTPAETRLALELTKGRALNSIAEEFGITKGTARIQLKSIFSKTGAKRQSELVNMVLTDPGFIMGGV